MGGSSQNTSHNCYFIDGTLLIDHVRRASVTAITPASMLLPLAHRIQSLQMDLTANYIFNGNRAEPNITIFLAVMINYLDPLGNALGMTSRLPVLGYGQQNIT